MKYNYFLAHIGKALKAFFTLLLMIENRDRTHGIGGPLPASDSFGGMVFRISIKDGSNHPLVFRAILARRLFKEFRALLA